MSVTVTFPVDQLDVTALIAAGWTTFSLWYAATPDGVYANSSATPVPATIASLTSSATNLYTTTFTYSSGSPAQWFKVRAYNGATYSDLSSAAPFHGGGGTTLTALRQYTGAEIRDLIPGSAAAGSVGGSMVLNTSDFLRFPDSYFQNWFINDTSSSAYSVISGWTQSSGVALTTSPQLGVTVGDLIEVSRRFAPLEYRNAINWAIQAAYPALSRTIVNEGLLTATQIYQFPVPQDMRSVSSVEIESSTSLSSTVQATRGQPYRNIPFRIVRDGLRQTIEIESQYTPSRRLRVIGTGPLSQLYNESDYVEEIAPQTDLIVYYAAARLYRGLPNEAASTDIDRFATLAKYYTDLADKMKDQYMQSRPAKRMWGPEARRGGSGSGLIGSWNPGNYA